MPRFSSVASLSNRGIINSAVVGDTLEYLIVAGGGSGGCQNNGAGGGGGAGGMLTGTKPIVLATDYTITVGAGGAGRLGTPYYGVNGSNSLAFNITAIGGGGGGGGTNLGDAPGQAGGSGGGGNNTGGGPSDGPGLGIAGQGNDGGVTNNFGHPNYPAAGGGGAGAVGGNVPSATTGGTGGAGLSSSITGLSVAYAGGGGGSTYGGGTPGNGGVGGGGGGANGYAVGTAGTANTGGGGGGSAGPYNLVSGAGGSGVVILKYPNTYSLTIDSGLTSTTDTSVTGFKITTFTAGTGSVEINETGEFEEPVAGFGEVATNFINTFSGTKKYIDITNGSDGNNGDTDAAAYRTLAYAQAQTAAIGTAVMYVIKPGVYDLTPTIILPSFSSVGISDGNLPRTFFCAAGQVIMQWTANSAERDAGMTNLQNANSAMYGAILKRNNNGKTNAYSVGMINGETAEPSNGDFYNCVFQETNANGNWALQYDNGGDEVTSILNNCSFYTTENGANDYAGGPGLILNNNAFRYAPGTTGATLNNAVTAQTMDATTYELTANNNTHGVYSGTYAWGTDMWVPEAPPETLEYLVVGGGGGGGNDDGGGGGAGGLIYQTDVEVFNNNNYTVTVGSGGAAQASGSNSIFDNSTAIGGGRGGGGGGAALVGGSGGGAWYNSVAAAGTAGQGFGGGSSVNAAPYYPCGGGGGAGGAGENGVGSTGGAGGVGSLYSISGTSTYYAGGGGGSINGSGTAGLGGIGGGGDGERWQSGGPTLGVAGSGSSNTGGGGGGGIANPGAGGSGVVILKYPAAWSLTIIDAGLTSTTDTSVTGFKITTFTAGTGSIQFSGIDSGTPADPPSVQYHIVAGGASGGSYGGGGGAGGLLEGTIISTFDEAINFTVGAGGAGITTGSTFGNDGSNSVALGLTAIGGGGGANNGSSPTTLAAHTGRLGGSGGGAGSQNYTSGAPGGAGWAGQGNRGGNATTPWAGQRGRGGGGAGAAGADGTGASVGPGGAGAYSSITGTNTAYAGGGGGYNWASTEKASGGVGGGGAGGASGSIQGTSGTANTGGGGGSGGPNSGAGGSGIIILKYSDTVTFTATAGLTSTTDTVTAPGFKITAVTAGTGTGTFSGVSGSSDTYSTHPTFGTLVATFVTPDWQPVGAVSVTEGYPALASSSNVIVSDANFQSIRAATTSNLVYYVWGANLENYVSFSRTTIESANVKSAPTTTINPNSFGFHPNFRTHWWSETSGSDLTGSDYSFMAYRDTNQLNFYDYGPTKSVGSSNAALINSNSNITDKFYIFYK